MPEGVYGCRLGEFANVNSSRTVELRLFQKAPFAITRVQKGKSDDGYVAPRPREDAYLVGLPLDDIPEHSYWVAGRHRTFPLLKAGQLNLFNLNFEHASYFTDPMDCMAFYVSRAALDGIASEYDAPRITTLRPELAVDDIVAQGLCGSLLPALQRPEQANRLFLDSVALAFLSHVARTYGEMRVRPLLKRGGLATWQERRAKEALLAQIDGNISLEQLADLTGVSRSHFSRAFKASTGLPPHRWLLVRRVEMAEEMLLTSKLPLEDIAAHCGFSDQSHFTRAFSRTKGVTPGEWRRRRRS